MALTLFVVSWPQKASERELAQPETSRAEPDMRQVAGRQPGSQLAAWLIDSTRQAQLSWSWSAPTVG